MNVLSRVQDIFRDFFDDATLVLRTETPSGDDVMLNEIEGWDSLAQVDIIVLCQSEFGVQFDLNDIVNLKSVGGIVNLIEKKLGS